MEKPYTKYSTTYLTGFDTWDPVQCNPGLAPLLHTLSEASPPEDQGDWTLDALFALPRLRLRYYKKLYARLLKNTQPERSDHPLLVRANERLEGLIAAVADRMDMTVGHAEGSRSEMTNSIATANSNSVPDFPDPPPKDSGFAPLPPIKRDNGRLSLDGPDPPRPHSNDSAPERIESSVSGSSRYVPQPSCHCAGIS